MKLICSIDLISLTSYFQFQPFKNKNRKQRTYFKLEIDSNKIFICSQTFVVIPTLLITFSENLGALHFMWAFFFCSRNAKFSNQHYHSKDRRYCLMEELNTKYFQQKKCLYFRRENSEISSIETICTHLCKCALSHTHSSENPPCPTTLAQSKGQGNTHASVPLKAALYLCIVVSACCPTWYLV